jgi:hypothetical protein
MLRPQKHNIMFEVADTVTASRRKGGSESQCAAQRLSCWEYWRCA